jgi:hypothetical protein
MSGRLRGFVVTLTVGLAVGACGSGAASLQDAAAVDAVPLPRPAPKFATAPTMPTWRHLPEPATAQQFNQDKAKCTKSADGTPGVGSPELKFYLVFTNCMRSEGYEATSGL